MPEAENRNFTVDSYDPWHSVYTAYLEHCWSPCPVCMKAKRALPLDGGCPYERKLYIQRVQLASQQGLVKANA